MIEDNNRAVVWLFGSCLLRGDFFFVGRGRGVYILQGIVYLICQFQNIDDMKMVIEKKLVLLLLLRVVFFNFSSASKKKKIR